MGAGGRLLAKANVFQFQVLVRHFDRGKVIMASDVTPVAEMVHNESNPKSGESLTRKIRESVAKEL